MEITTRCAKKSRCETAWAVCGSLLLHAILLLVLNTSSPLDLLVGPESRFDIFWIAPSAQLPSSTASTGGAGTPGARTAADEADMEELVPPLRNAAEHVRGEVTETAREGAAAQHTELRQLETAEPASPEMQLLTGARAPLPASGPAIADPARLPKAVAAFPPALPKAATTPAAPSKAAPPAVRVRKQSSPPRAAKPAEPVPPRVPVAKAPAIVPAKESPPTPARPTLHSAALAKSPLLQQNHQRPKRPAAPRNPSAPAGAGKSPAAPAATAAGEKGQLKEKNAVTMPDKVPEPRGLVISSLRGDLKMVVSGDSSITLFVTFRPYPKSRRDRVSRSEAGEQQKVSPLVARTKPEVKEAVIETAREGVYTFAAASGRKEGAKAAFTLKIFESGNREKVAEIGSRTVSARKVLAKVLMPEGILWDDDAAFSGSLEDSDSTTKFNAQTGVYWKEYND